MNPPEAITKLSATPVAANTWPPPVPDELPPLDPSPPPLLNPPPLLLPPPPPPPVDGGVEGEALGLGVGEQFGQLIFALLLFKLFVIVTFD